MGERITCLCPIGFTLLALLPLFFSNNILENVSIFLFCVVYMFVTVSFVDTAAGVVSCENGKLSRSSCIVNSSLSFGPSR